MQGILAILETILGNPEVQAPAVAFVAAALKAKLPAGFEPDVKAFLTSLAASL